LSVALSERTRSKLTIRHTKGAQGKLDGVHEALSGIRADMLTVEEKLNFLAGRRVTRESMTAVLDRLFPKPKAEDGAEKDSSARRNNVLGDILALYESNDQNAFPEQRGTAYGLLNAVTEYTDHARRVARGRRRSRLGEMQPRAAVRSPPTQRAPGRHLGDACTTHEERELGEEEHQ
jgi:hypothetical protein